MKNEIMDKVSEFIRKDILNKPSRSMRYNEPLISSGLIDSFHLVDLAIFIEDIFGVRIDDSELNSDTFDNLEELGEIISQRM